MNASVQGALDLSNLDFGIIVGYLVFVLFIGLWMSRKTCRRWPRCS